MNFFFRISAKISAAFVLAIVFGITVTLMNKSRSVGQDEFEALLALLSSDREAAGERYERVRRGLLRYFRYRGFSDPTTLVDETFDRVARRSDQFDPSLSERPEQFIYGFAAFIALEHRRKAGREVPLEGIELLPSRQTPVAESDLDRLEMCLAGLEPADRDLIMEYHSFDGSGRSEGRQMMCERLNSTSTAIYARVSRIRSKLKSCIDDARNVRV